MAATSSTDRPTKRRLADSGDGWNRAKLVSGICYDFDGVNDWGDVGDTSQTCQTVSFSLYCDTITTQNIIDFDGGTHTITVSSGTVTASGFDSPTIYIDGIEGSAILATVWYNVTIVTQTGFDVDNLDIGRISSSYFGGRLADIKIFDEALTATQVFDNYTFPEYATPPGLSSNSLVGWWKFNGDATDSSGNSNDCTISGASIVYGQGAPVSQSITAAADGLGVFNGNEYVETPDKDSLDITNTISLAAWVKFDNTGSQETIVGKKNTYELAKGSSENIIMSIYQTTNKFTTSTTTLSIGTWYYVVGTYDTTGTMQIYINGELDKTDTSYSGAIDGTANHVTIGQLNNSTYWAGQLDEIKVYNKVLSASEVVTNYRAGLSAHS